MFTWKKIEMTIIFSVVVCIQLLYVDKYTV